MSRADDIALELARIRVLKDIVAAQEQTLRAEAEQEMKVGARAIAELPDGTKVGAVNRKKGAAGKAKVTDEAAFRAWVKLLYPSEVVVTETVRSSFKESILKGVLTSGELPDGVDIAADGKPQIAMDPLPAGAAEAILADFRVNGIGGVVTLPAIED
jgi:hypothetical protein